MPEENPLSEAHKMGQEAATKSLSEKISDYLNESPDNMGTVQKVLSFLFADRPQKSLIWDQVAGDSKAMEFLGVITNIMPDELAQYFKENPDAWEGLTWDTYDNLPEELKPVYDAYQKGELMKMASGVMSTAPVMTPAQAALVNTETQLLKEAGASNTAINAFLKETEKQFGRGVGVEAAIEAGKQKMVSDFGGFGGSFLGPLKSIQPFGTVLSKAALGGTAVGGIYMAHSAITQIPFAGFMSEEMEQTSMFAEFPVMDNPVELAQVIAYVTLPTWERGEYYATTLAPRVTWLPSQYTWSETAQTMADYHNIPFTGKVASEVQRLQEMGAWKGFEGEPQYDNEGKITGWNITSWGEPTSADERQEFLATPEGEKYIKNYEGEIQRLAQEDPGKLYALYQQGVIGWYDMSEDMRNTITTYQQQLKNWQYQSLRNFDPQDVLDLGSTVASQVWYGQEDMGILEQAKQIGDWIYTLVQNGELSAREAEPVLQELSLRLRGNENAEGIWTVDENGNKTVAWNTLSEDQLNEQFGSTEKLVEMPQLSFGDKPVTLSQTERDAVQYLENQGMIQKTQGTLSPEDVKMRFGPALGQRITGLEAEELERVFNEFAGSAKGVESMRGVGFTGGATAEEQAAMAAVPGSGFTWTPREDLTRAEEQALSQVENGIRSWDDIKNITPETYDSLVQKGYGPGVKTPATQTPTQAGVQGVSDTDVENFFNAIMEEAQQTAGQYGVFETPTKVKGEPLYTPEMLKAMEQFGTPQERATAQKQQDIYNKQKYAGKDKGTYGYELASLSNDQRKMLEELATVLETGEIPEKSKLVRHEATQPGWGTTYGYGSIKK